MRAGEPTSEAALVARAAGGDADAYGAIYDQHVQTVYRFLLRRCGDAHEAEDLLSVVFLEAWRARARMVAIDDSSRPWLLGIAMNVVRNSRRSTRRHAAALARYDADPLTGAPTHDFADDAVARLDANTAAGRITVAMARLTAREREVAELCLLEQLPTGTVALVLGVPEGTVKSRLASARKRLQRVLQTSELPTQVVAADMNTVSGRTSLRPEASAP
ncbi:MAG: hypothetical protein QOG52_1795 [Frankiaceae bacterium]|jgi:RNA polymerase sigma-70 factor (ECF subfamily)|nr:hypothetical protein [Frankiaceae bacterium]